MNDLVLGPSQADWAALERELEIDPVTFEVLRHKMEAINEQQAIALKAVSASPIVTEASDFNNAIYTPEGDIISMGPQVVFHSGGMTRVIKHVIADCANTVGIREGDMFAVNDPYKGAPHHPDVSLVAPIHHDGELIGWTGATAHQVDVGGMTVGSISVEATEKQQEGLMLPPIKVVEAGTLRQDVWNLILNMSRQPQLVELDLKGFVASNIVSRRRLLELVDQYGIHTVRTVMKEMIRYSERRFRERLRRLPDGEFRSQGFLDHDGHSNRVYRTDLLLQKDGDVLRFDLSGSSEQAPGFVNCTESGLIGAVYGGTAPLLAHDIPWNNGLMNALEIVAPPGLICNAVAPAPTGAATISEAWLLLNTVVHAVSKLVSLSDDHRPNGQAVTNGTFDALIIGDRNQHGEPYGTQLMDAQLGGGGASFVADGIDQSGGFVTPRPNIPNVETNEMHGPMLYLYRSFFPDSGGDGALRGGRAAGIAWTPHDIDRVRCTMTTHGVEVPVSPGLSGGYPGTCNRRLVVRGTRIRDLLEGGRLPIDLSSREEPIDLAALEGETTVLPAKVREFTIQPGDVLQATWSGGGGVGDPLLRDPKRVVDDIRFGYVTRSKAYDVYGVVSDGNSMDMEGTEERRDLMRRQRLEAAELPVRRSHVPQGETVTAFGVALLLSRGIGGLQIECRCGYVFSPADENWKEQAGRLVLEGGLRPGGIVVHLDLQLVAYLCPSCGTIHAVDVGDKGATPIQDLKITGDL